MKTSATEFFSFSILLTEGRIKLFESRTDFLNLGIYQVRTRLVQFRAVKFESANPAILQSAIAKNILKNC